MMRKNERYLTNPPPPPPPFLPAARRVALDLYFVKPLVFRKLPDLGIATRVKMSPPPVNKSFP